MKRQNWLFLLFCTCLVLMLITLPPLPTNAKATPMDPIKIGGLMTLTGPQTTVGNSVKSGLTIAFEEVGWKIAGREVQLIIEDDEMKPPVALQKARKLVESDHVDVLAGVVHSGVAIAVRDYIDEQKVPVIISCASSDDITREKASKYLFRTSYSSRMIEGPMAPYAYKKLGFRRAYIVAADYVTGHERSSWFKRFFEQLGGKVVGEVFPPVGTTDFAPYLTKIRDVDGVWVFLPGSDGVQFVKQYDEYGLKKKIPLIGSVSTFQAFQLEVQKDSALGAICSDLYSIALNTPENQKFLKTCQKVLRGHDPDVTVESSYIAGRVIIEGIKNTKGDTKDVPKLLESFRRIKLTAPRGPFRFDEKQNPVSNVYINKVVKKDGRYTVDLIETYRDVHQDWTP